MLSLSLQTCNVGTGACVMTWHWGEFGQQLSLYHAQFIPASTSRARRRSSTWSVSFPIAYWIAFHGGNKKNFFLLMLLVPFFVSFVIRTVVWEFILSDQGIILGSLKNAHLLPQNFHVLATGYAVVAGLAYNYLPFTALPLYVAIERIDKRVLDAAYDLYATRRQAFFRVILPLTVPGLFAAFLLTFVPALGDYVNQQILGGTSNTMIGTVIQNAFLVNLDYAGGSALSAVLMAIALVGIFAYARLLGSRTHRGLHMSAVVTAPAGAETGQARQGRAAAAVDPVRPARLFLAGHRVPGLPDRGDGSLQLQQGHHRPAAGQLRLERVHHPVVPAVEGHPQLTSAFWLSIRLAIVATLFATVIGTLLALALVRYRPPRFRGRSLVEQVLFLNIAAPEIVLGASLLGLFVTVSVARGFVTLLLAHVAFSIAYVTVTVRARMAGFDRTLEEAAADLGANAWVTFRKITFPLIMPGILAGALMAFALSIDDFVTSNFVSGAAVPFPVWVYGATRIGIPPQVFVFGSAIFAVGILCALTSIVVARKQT